MLGSLQKANMMAKERCSVQMELSYRKVFGQRENLLKNKMLLNLNTSTPQTRSRKNLNTDSD